MKTHLIVLAAVLGGSAGLAFATEPAQTGADARVSVNFVDPQHFTDLKEEDAGDTSPQLLDQLKDFIAKTGASYVPAGMRLEVSVTDVDMAGRFEPWRGPQWDHVRIVKSIYPPRIRLDFKLTDARGRVVNSGQRSLTDLAFQTRDPFLVPSDDSLRYEKDLLRDWFRSEFKSTAMAGN